MQTKRKAVVPEVVPGAAKARAKISLTGIKLWSTNIRTLLLNLFFLIIVIVLVPLLIGQFQRNQVIIEPIAVPDVLAKRGLTADVVANRIWDGLSDVKIAANTTKETVASLPDRRRVKFSFPDSGVSIESLIFHIRRLFNAYETRVAGEFVCGDIACSPAQLRLWLRVIRDPFVAIVATSQAQPLKATILARRLVSTKHQDAKWAYNLIGPIGLNAGDTADALQEIQAALALDADFVPARINLGNTLFTTGDMDGAKKAYQAVFDREPRNVLATEGFAELMRAAGDSAGAVRAYLDAAQMDPANPRYATKAGRIEIAAGHTGAGVTLFTQALALDPSYLPTVTAIRIANPRLWRPIASFLRSPSQMT